MFKARPILFSSQMIRSLLSGSKTQTRRIMKPQPEFLYRLMDDRISPVHIDIGAFNEINKAIGRSDIEAYSCFTEPRLHGGLRWVRVLTDEIQRLWEKGIRGLVSVTRSQKQEGIFNCIVVPQQHKSDKECSSLGVHGFSRDAGISIASSSAFGRRPAKQYPGQSEVGNADGELAGSRGAWSRHEGRETSCVEARRQGAGAHQMGDPERIMQPATRCASSWNEPVCNTTYCRYEIDSLLWLRETWRTEVACYDDLSPSDLSGEETILYGADANWSLNHTVGRGRSPIHMPRWASRLTLRITDIRVERVQEISEDDAKAEGVTYTDFGTYIPNGSASLDGGKTFHPFKPRQYPGFHVGDVTGPDQCHPSAHGAFAGLWQSINGEESWTSNPWIWVLSFEVIKANVDEIRKKAA